MPVAGTPAAGQTLFRVAEIAARLTVDKTTVYRQIKAGRLEAIRIGSGRGTVRVPAESLAKYEASITAAATGSAELTVDTPLGSVDLVAVERFRNGGEVTLTAAESALLALLQSHAAEFAEVAA
jgi:excisionase family DNA binding protein